VQWDRVAPCGIHVLAAWLGWTFEDVDARARARNSELPPGDRATAAGITDRHIAQVARTTGAGQDAVVMANPAVLFHRPSLALLRSNHAMMAVNIILNGFRHWIFVTMTDTGFQVTDNLDILTGAHDNLDALDVQGIVLLQTAGNTVAAVANAATEALTADMLGALPPYPVVVDENRLNGTMPVSEMRDAFDLYAVECLLHRFGHAMCYPSWGRTAATFVSLHFTHHHHSTLR
jgi:hypothetical protein